MRILIDARSYPGSGVQAYTRAFLNHLKGLPRKDDFTVLTLEGSGDLHEDDFPTISIPARNPMETFFQNQVLLPRLIRRHDIQLYHSHKNIAALSSRCSKVLTLHSAGTFLFPDLWRRWDGLQWRILTRQAFRRMDHIITLSRTDRDNLLGYVGSSFNSKTSVIYLAPRPSFRPIEDRRYLETVREKYDLPERYILWVGTIHPFKNLEVLFRAFNFMTSQRKMKQVLILCGNRGWFWKNTMKIAQSLALGDRLRFLETVIQDDLPALYEMADLFVLPSIYESFSLAPLEAMACGTPVVASTAGACPEILGDAAILVDPYSAEELADAMYAMLKSKDLRKEFIEKGFQKAAEYSWEKCVKKTFAVYNMMRP